MLFKLLFNPECCSLCRLVSLLLYVTAYKEQFQQYNIMLVDYSGLGLLTRKFTITHPSVVAVITVTHVHVPLNSTTRGN